MGFPSRSFAESNVFQRVVINVTGKEHQNRKHENVENKIKKVALKGFPHQIRLVVGEGRYEPIQVPNSDCQKENRDTLANNRYVAFHSFQLVSSNIILCFAMVSFRGMTTL